MKLPEFIEKINFIKDNVWNADNLFVTVELDGKNKQSNVIGVVYDNERLRVKVVDGDFITPTMECPEGMHPDTFKAMSEETHPLTTHDIAMRMKALEEQIEGLQGMYALAEVIEGKKQVDNITNDC